MGGESLVRKRFVDDVLLVLATLFYRKGSLKGRTRFQKTVFLLKEKFDVPFTFKFRPYYFGPYSEDLTDLISVLEAVGVLDEMPQRLGIDIVRYNYKLTEKGKAYFRKFKGSAEKETLEKLEKLKENIIEINQMNTRDLISTAKALVNWN
jgi:uncharacterized protein YwgA